MNEKNIIGWMEKARETIEKYGFQLNLIERHPIGNGNFIVSFLIERDNKVLIKFISNKTPKDQFLEAVFGKCGQMLTDEMLHDCDVFI